MASEGRKWDGMIRNIKENQGPTVIRKRYLRSVKRLLMVVDTSAMSEEKRD